MDNKVFIALVASLHLVIGLIGCNKDTEPSTSRNDDKENLYRDWSKKGSYTPAPKPGKVLK